MKTKQNKTKDFSKNVKRKSLKPLQEEKSNRSFFTLFSKLNFKNLHLTKETFLEFPEHFKK